MKITNSLAILSMIVGLAGCCGGGNDSPPSRWEDNKASSTESKKDDDKKKKKKTDEDEPAPVAAGALNKFFPEDGADGAKRVFKADKPGYAEAKYTLSGDKELTVTINDLAGKPDDRAKFSSASEKVSGNPYKTFGKNKSQILVGDRFQVDVMSQQLDEDARKPWLKRVDLSGLSALK